jgi:hypothetical protein
MSENKIDRKKRRVRLKLEDAPQVNSIKDLIEIGKSIKFYKNIDTIMLWKIIPHLEELEKLVGMKSLKESVFYQILYYIQGMHTRGNEEYLHTILMGPPGTGKCLGKNTPILMYNGDIKMVQDIKLGDKLMGDDSTVRNVLNVCTGKELLYEIHQTYGDNYIVNKSHILSLKLSKNHVVKHDHLKKQIIIMWYDKYDYHEKKFNYRNQPTEEDYCMINKFIKSVPKKGAVIDISVKNYLKRSNKWKDAFKGYKTIIDFKSNNCVENGFSYGCWVSNQLKNIDCNVSCISKEYKCNDKNIRMQFLSGLVCNIGSYNKLGNMFELNIYHPNTNVKQLLNDIVFISRSLGFKTIMKQTSIKYKISIIGNTKLLLPQFDIKTNTKKSEYEMYTDLLFYDINVKQLDEGDYYGFEIDNNRRFVLGDLTVTHNTTVAKIIGQIYKSMGILSEKGTFRIAHRDDFIAGYLGQTAIKTQKLLESCIGGVLFIDEVYALGPGKDDRDSFSKEALDTLTSFLSEHKSDFCCIAAGYEKDIEKCFFSVNQGLKSRFTWIHNIEKYTPTELVDILFKMVGEMNWEMGASKKTVQKILEKEKELFKNAGRDIYTFIGKCKMAHSRRVFTLDKRHKFVLTKKDIEDGIKMVKTYSNKKEEKNSDPPIGMYL